jgi:DNA-directed RNA polymerase specialized sigma24 family protein
VHIVLKLLRRQARHEDVAVEHYDGLRRAALHLARGDGTEADDVLHDTLVRFLLLRPDLERIDRLEGYLYTMLRNVYLSRLRRHGRRNALFADGIDLDLLGGLAGGPRAGHGMALHDDLVRIVAHACERTRASRGASAWVLRCLHGYYPSEIAQVMKMPSRAVDRALHVARREAIEERRRPSQRLLERLRGGARLWRGLIASAERSDGTADPFDVVRALRARVFASVHGPCLSEEHLAELYRPGCDEPAGTLVMAHVVACAACLDRINHRLGLSPLHLRDPIEANLTRKPRGGDTHGDDEGDGPASAGAADGDPPSAGRSRLRPGGNARDAAGAGPDPLLRRTRETIASIVDHVPRSLRIVANGFDLGAQPVTGTVTEQELAVRLAETLAFVEIFDERGMVVCYWQGHLPNEAALDEHASIDLGGGRRVDLQVSLAADCPRLRMCYTDERVAPATGSADRRGVHAFVPAPRARADRWAEDGRLGREPDPWWRRIVPSRRAVLAFGMLVTLWMVLVGPTSTWAALTHLGRVAAAAIRALTSPAPQRPPSPSPAATAPTSAATPVAPAGPVRSFGASELADLEMDARVTLHAMRADLGEDVTLSSSPAGVVVRGVVASGARRTSIGRAFTGRDGVRVEVRAAHDVAAAAPMKSARARGAGASAPQRVDPNTPPEFARPVLEAALAARLPDPSARVAFVDAALAHAGDALSRAWALRRLAERYPPREVVRLGVRSSQALATLIDDHVAAIAAAVDALTSHVGALLVAAGGDDATAPPAVDGRPSILELHAEVSALHAETHGLLAGGGTGTDTPRANAGDPDAPQAAAASLRARLRRIAHAVREPEFASDLRPR